MELWLEFAELADLEALRRANARMPAERRVRERVLTQWATVHMRYPYPSRKQVTRLATSLGLSHAQIRTWFANYRKRYLRPSCFALPGPGWAAPPLIATTALAPGTP